MAVRSKEELTAKNEADKLLGAGNNKTLRACTWRDSHSVFWAVAVPRWLRSVHQ
jgi:hypothetical protein